MQRLSLTLHRHKPTPVCADPFSSTYEAHEAHSVHVVCNALWALDIASNPARPFGDLKHAQGQCFSGVHRCKGLT